MNDIRSKAAKGAVWMVLFKMIDRGIGLLSTLILARVLAPESFGVIAMATSFMALLELLSAFGFDMALIQRGDATRDHYDTAWTFSVVLGVVIGVLMASLSVPIGHYYQRPDLWPVLCTLAVGSVLQGFNNVGTVAFRKDLEFHKEFRFLLTKKLVTFPLTIGLAFLLRNHWALVAGMVTGRATDLLLSYRLHPYRPRLCLKAAGDLLHFSKWLLFLNSLMFLRDRSADFVLGRFGGAGSLGLFSVSYELANLPATELVAPINRAVYPAYAKLASEPDALRREYLSIMGMIALIAIPAVAGTAATAPLIVPLLLGAKWLAAIPILRILAFFGISQVMWSNAYALCLAKGRGDVFSRLNGAYVVILIALLLFLSPKYGAVGAAYGYVIAALSTLPVGIAVVLRLLSIRAFEFLREMWRPLIGAALMFIAVYSITDTTPPEAKTPYLALMMLEAVGLGAAIYGASVAALWWLSGRPESSAERVIWNRGMQALASLRRKFFSWAS